MPESQNVEYKSGWRDEFLKWICGFANATGGRIFIDLDNTGEIIGVTDSKKLLEDIPNKVRDTLEILVDVNLHETDKGDYIEIVVESYSYPVNYKGQSSDSRFLSTSSASSNAVSYFSSRVF